MGIIMSFMGGGSMYSHMLNIASRTVYDRFVEKDIKTFDEFHLAVLDIFNNFNSALPGKHFDAPSRKEIEKFFKDWKEEAEPKRREIYVEFMRKNVNLNKIDDTTMITGVMMPPVAMVAKRAGETVPQLKMIKVIPDVVFVPSATVLALFSVKISRRVLMGKMAS
ncbi:uncharacterized protein LOC21404667 [Morus notabilis]|uniref:uncharacterized protein LOC21404667 n=1 Tax=Morus notabilis TaxID=981085 RepID=UPI000CED643B|nr:uncharacterized protein LOC21404667 [Morus notabilis]